MSGFGGQIKEDKVMHDMSDQRQAMTDDSKINEVVEACKKL